MLVAAKLNVSNILCTISNNNHLKILNSAKKEHHRLIQLKFQTHCLRFRNFNPFPFNTRFLLIFIDFSNFHHRLLHEYIVQHSKCNEEHYEKSIFVCTVIEFLCTKTSNTSHFMMFMFLRGEIGILSNGEL